MKAVKMQQAEKIRYDKIERLTNLLCKENYVPMDYSAMSVLDKHFSVGKRITVDGQKIVINKKTYSALDIKMVTINTEGSFSIYDRRERKICGWAALNLSSKNIELFCLWVRKNNIPAKAVSGSVERGFQLFILAAAIFVLVLVKVIHIFFIS